MKKKNIIKILVFVIIVILAVIFMFMGAKEQSRKYSIEEVKDYKYFVLQQDGKYGVLDKNAKVIIEPKYENVVIPNPSKDLFICTTENKQTKIYNEKKEEKFSEYEEITSIKLKNIASNLMYEKSVLRYKSGEKYGLIDYKGSKITEPVYGQINGLDYKEGELLVEQDGKYGVINIKGIELVPIKYETVKVDEFEFNNNYNKAGYIVGIKTEDGYRYGYIDVEGKEVLKTEYNEISRIIDIESENDIYLLASKNGQYGVYKNNNQIIGNEYQSISYNKNNNIFIVEKSKKYGALGIDGSSKINVKYAQIDINGKYIYAKDRNGTTEVFDADGKKVDISENIFKISAADGKYNIVITNSDEKTTYGLENKDEKELVKSQYNYMEYLFDNYFIASNSEGKLGIIDDKGNVKVEFKYSSIQKIKETSLIQTTSAENLIEIYSEKFEKICEMNNAIITEINGYTRVYNGKENIYISEKGEKTDSKNVYKKNTLFAVKKDDKWGFEDANKNLKVDCKYDRVTEFNQFGYAGIEQEGKWGVIDSNGNIILQPKYEIKNREDPSFLGIYYKVTYGFGEVIYTNN